MDWLFSNAPGGFTEGDNEKDAEALWKEVKDDLNFVIVRKVTMPGVVTRSEQFSRINGRDAILTKDRASLKTADDLAKAPIVGLRTITAGKHVVPEAELKAFKLEMEEAIAQWPKVKEGIDERVAARQRNE